VHIIYQGRMGPARQLLANYEGKGSRLSAELNQLMNLMREMLPEVKYVECAGKIELPVALQEELNRAYAPWMEQTISLDALGWLDLHAELKHVEPVSIHEEILAAIAGEGVLPRPRETYCGHYETHRRFVWGDLLQQPNWTHQGLRFGDSLVSYGGLRYIGHKTADIQVWLQGAPLQIMRIWISSLQGKSARVHAFAAKIGKAAPGVAVEFYCPERSDLGWQEIHSGFDWNMGNPVLLGQ